MHAKPEAASDPFTLVTGEPSAPVVAPEVADGDVSTLRDRIRYGPGPLLGAGGMGEVHLEVDRRIGRSVAKKTLRAGADEATARLRFLREVRIQGQLEHPAIVPVYDLDVDESGRVYFTMKRVRGDTLERVLGRLRAKDAEAAERFPLRRLLGAFAQVCRAVAYAHARRVTHRDLKPSNLMLGDFGEIYVLDWGLARVDGDRDEPASSRAVTAEQRAKEMEGAVVDDSGALTVSGMVLGTPAYMAPEQFTMYGGTFDHRVDLYALGSILFEILTLRRARLDASPLGVIRSLAAEAVVHPSDHEADVPPELDELCARCLAVDPAARPNGAAAIADAVERYLAGEHDLALRRGLAERHAASAERLLEGARAPGQAALRVEAMREAMKALALDAEDKKAQRLMVELLTDTSSDVPAEAQPELMAQEHKGRARAAKLAAQGLLAWLAVFPLVLAIGVRSWPAVAATAAATAASVAFAYHLSRAARVTARSTAILAALVALVVAFTSCYMGPFVVVPTCAATAAVCFGIASTRRERPAIAILLALGVLLPFVAEMTGIPWRAYAFEPGRVVVFERAVALPARATLGSMLYSSVAFPILAIIFVGRLRDTLQAAERRQFLQAWLLRQLFR